MKPRRAPALARLAVAATLAAACGVGQAQTLFVTEQLVVNLNSAPDASGEHIATLKSGDHVELIERAGDAMHVRLANGRDGWLRATYLSADEPLSVRLAERDREVAQLKEDLAQARARPAAGAAPPPAVPQPRASPAAPVEDAAALPPPLFPPASEHGESAWPWGLGFGILGLAVGFALGVLLLDRHIRRKFGGLRIY